VQSQQAKGKRLPRPTAPREDSILHWGGATADYKTDQTQIRVLHLDSGAF